MVIWCYLIEMAMDYQYDGLTHYTGIEICFFMLLLDQSRQAPGIARL